MNFEPKISIIMNCYNGEEFLQTALQSVLFQTYTNWELIFWDNVSTDNSSHIFKSIKDRRFNYYYSKNHDLLYAARNKAIEKSKGEFLAFLDVDDFWDPQKLEKQIILFKDKKVGAVYSNFWFLSHKNGKSKKNYKYKLPNGYITNNLLENYQIGLLTLIIRKDIFLNLKFDNTFHIIGDFDFCIRLSMKWKIAVVQDCLGTYRWHGKNESANKILLQAIELKKWKNKIYEELSVSNRSFLDDKILRITVNHFLNKKKYKESIKLISNMKNIKNIFRTLIVITYTYLTNKIFIE